MAGIYKSKYSGAQIDMAIENALKFNPEENGWIKIPSSEDYPIDLNELKSPGNYIIEYFINGPVSLEITPINITVVIKNNVLIQYINMLDDLYYRNGDDYSMYPDEWYTRKTSNYIYTESVPDEPEPNSLAILKDEEGNYTLNIYDKEKEKFVLVSIPDIMRQSIYDSELRQTDFFRYVDDMYVALTGCAIGIEWTISDNTDWIGYALSSMKYIAEDPVNFIMTFKNSNMLLYSRPGSSSKIYLDDNLVEPQLMVFEDSTHIVVNAYIYDNGTSTIYQSSDCMLWTKIDMNMVDMHFDLPNVYIKPTNLKMYGIQPKATYNTSSNLKA